MIMHTSASPNKAEPEHPCRNGDLGMGVGAAPCPRVADGSACLLVYVQHRGLIGTLV